MGGLAPGGRVEGGGLSVGVYFARTVFEEERESGGAEDDGDVLRILRLVVVFVVAWCYFILDNPAMDKFVE